MLNVLTWVTHKLSEIGYFLFAVDWCREYAVWVRKKKTCVLNRNIRL